MAQYGQPSKAHEYDERGECIYCRMYKVNVDRIVHVCTPAREMEVDKMEAEKTGIVVEKYRRGGVPSPTI